MIDTRYLIIGNSAGGIGAAEAIREVDRKGSIVLASDEPYPSYSRPLIAKYLAGKRTLDEILFRAPDFYTSNKINTFLGSRVTAVQLPEQIAQLEGGKMVRWQKLLIAAGGKPIVPRIDGLNKKGVFNFLTLNDVKEMKKTAEKAKRAVIIGGGPIGLSAADSLCSMGIKVTVVEMKERVLNTILDEQASLLVEAAVKSAGVSIITGHTVNKIAGKSAGDGEVGAAILDTGDWLGSDLVVVAIGVSPRLELVNGTGLKVNRGIAVDSYMTTSHPGVYACGDVSEAYDFIYGQSRLIPIWPNAYIGGRVAGYNMAGARTEYQSGTSMNSLNYFGLPVISAGMVVFPDGEGYEAVTVSAGERYTKIVLKDGKIKGMIFIGAIEKAGIIFGLMKDRVDVSSFKKLLATADFTPAALPTEIRNRRTGQIDWNLFTRAESAVYTGKER